MKKDVRMLANADIRDIVIAAPEGHQHLRTTITLHSGEMIVLQEATVANLVRAYLQVKTHPQRETVRMVGWELDEGDRKKGFARWQLLEEDQDE